MKLTNVVLIFSVLVLSCWQRALCIKYGDIPDDSYKGYYGKSLTERIDFLSVNLNSTDSVTSQTALAMLENEALFLAIKTDHHDFLKRYQSGRSESPWKSSPHGPVIRELFTHALDSAGAPLKANSVHALTAYCYSAELYPVYLNSIDWAIKSVDSKYYPTAEHPNKWISEDPLARCLDIVQELKGCACLGPEELAEFAYASTFAPDQMLAVLSTSDLPVPQWLELVYLWLVYVEGLEAVLAKSVAQGGWYSPLKDAFYAKLEFWAGEPIDSTAFFVLAVYFYDEEHHQLLLQKGNWSSETGTRMLKRIESLEAK